MSRRDDDRIVYKLYKALGLLPEQMARGIEAGQWQGGNRLPEAMRTPEHMASFQSTLGRNVLRHQDAIKQTPPKHRLRVASAAAQSELWPHSIVELPTPETILTPRQLRRVEQVQQTFPYPCAPMELRAKLVLGWDTRWLSRDMLSKKDAHLWLSCYPDGEFLEEADDWYMRYRMGLSPEQQPPAAMLSPVFKWFVGVWGDPARRKALLKERVLFGPYGEEIRGRFFDRIDELYPEDLTRSVERTFRNAVERVVAEEGGQYELDEELIEVPEWWIDTPYAKLLRTKRELILEGKEMAHCAGMYTVVVAEGESLVISIRTSKCRSTVDLDPRTFRVKQHVGEGNKEPHPDCILVLEKFHPRWEAKWKVTPGFGTGHDW